MCPAIFFKCSSSCPVFAFCALVGGVLSCCCCVLFSVLFYAVKNSVFVFVCNVFAFLCCGFYSVCGCALCAVWCRGQWSVAQYTRGSASTCKGAEGADSNSGPGERDAGEEMFTAESAHRASPAGALPLSHRERKLHRCLLTRCYTSHSANRAYPTLEGLFPQKRNLCHHLITVITIWLSLFCGNRIFKEYSGHFFIII